MNGQRPARKFDPDVLAAVSALLADRPEVSPRGMFGHPGFAVGGKVIATLYEDGVAVKLPADQVAAALAREHAQRFRPYGKEMREWVYLHHAAPAAYAGDIELFEAAIAYGGALAAGAGAGGRPRRSGRAAGRKSGAGPA